MTAWRETQSAFRKALFDTGAEAIEAAVAGDGLTPRERVAVYRHHVRASLVGALATSFPVVHRLVGAKFFEHAAWMFARSTPPSSPCLFEYGAGFADFLGSFSPGRKLVYLRDVARLEWAINSVVHAEEVPPLDRAELDRIDPRDAPRLRFRLRPGLAYLASPWPVDAIWRSNRPGPEEGRRVDLAEGEARLEIRSSGEQVVFRSLAPGECAFRAALGDNWTLEAAAMAAFEADPAFDLTAALRALVAEGALAGWSLGSVAAGG